MAGGRTHCTAGGALRRGGRIPPFAVVVDQPEGSRGLRPLLGALAEQRDPAGRPITVVASVGCGLASAAAAFDAVADGSVELHLLREGADGQTVLHAAASQLERRREGGEPVLLLIHPEAVPAPDWIAGNLQALAAGADLVCGVGVPTARGVGRLPPTVDAAVRYRRLVARLEDTLDPLPWDPAPRHGDESGLSLALRLSALRAAGAAPDVPELARRHLVLRVRQAGGVVRHCPQTRVFVPSHRLSACATDGLLPTAELPMRAPDPELLEATLRRRAALRHELRRRYARLAEVERERAVRAHLALTVGDVRAAGPMVPVEQACRRLRERLGQLGVPCQGGEATPRSGRATAERERQRQPLL